MRKEPIEEAIAIFGTQVRNTRIQLGMTQEELADKVELSPNYIGYIERADRHPGIYQIIAISFALGVSPAALFNDVNVPDDLYKSPE
ncbi:MAG: helix-turn-helix transcriptional regulator [Halobacillus sp.]|uniref:helix-turn-helix domain-containing protein n=1 Tax=Halobacillus sp. TaxID=56800 RepID=UPI003BB20FD2